MSVRVLTGDCRDVLPTLAAGSVHCVVTSPPYFGLRDYGHAGQIGLEPSPDEFVAAMVEVFGQVRRVLRDDGVAWLNLGDSYGAEPGQRKTTDSAGPKQRTNNASTGAPSRSVDGLGGGNLLGIPWRVALALQADGWTLRQAVTWAKVAPMPESVAGTRWERCRVRATVGLHNRVASGSTPQGNTPHRDGAMTGDAGRSEWHPCPGCPRCAATDGYVLRRGSWRHTSATEMVFMLTKGLGYWANQEAAREAHAAGSWEHIQRYTGAAARYNAKAAKTPGQPPQTNATIMPSNPAGRNPRNWVTPSPSPFPGAHFATFTPALIEPFIRATCPAKCCPTCGAGWAVVVERSAFDAGMGTADASAQKSEQVRNGGHRGERVRTPTGHTMQTTVPTLTGYRPTCSCPLAAPVPGTCLDPFAGAGTTLLVADRLGLNAIGIELNPAYAEMAERRIYADAPLFAEVLS